MHQRYLMYVLSLMYVCTCIATSLAGNMSSEQAMIGGHDCQWAEDPPDDLICLVCLCVARDPHQHGNGGCGRVFCQACLGKLNKTCPNCRKSLNTFKDERSSRQIRALKIKCEKLGCSWEGALCSQETHQLSCGYTLLACTNQCTKKDQIFRILRKDLQKHLTEECPRRQYRCPDCMEMGEYQERTTSHLEICPKRKMPCPYGLCLASMPESELPAHMHTCVHRRVVLEYTETSSDKTEQRKELIRESHFYLLLQQTQTPSVQPFVFSLTEYEKHLNQHVHFYSSPFYTSGTGYSLCLRVAPNGDTPGHISVYAHLMKGDNDDSLTWPFTGTVIIELLNQLEDDNHHMGAISFPASNRASKRVADGQRAERGYGCTQFISHNQLDYNPTNHHQYLDYNTLIFRVTAV